MIKKIKHERVETEKNYMLLFPNKFENDVWDVKVSMDTAFVLLNHGMDPERKMIISVSRRHVRR